MPTTHQQWNSPPIGLKLLEHEVHVWRAHLNQSASTLNNLQQLLSEEELARAKRFFFEKDRSHFIIARGILRYLLGRYLNTDPVQLRFRYNAYGKPALDIQPNEISLKFNLSHSCDLALLAFSYSYELGIDVEFMRSDVTYEKVAKYYFSPYEISLLHTLPPEMIIQGFYNAWTRKEAYIKGRGQGISIPLDIFDVSLKPGEPAELVNSREDAQETSRWSMQELYPGPYYAGALIVE